jgi:hypothetical protein
LAGDYHASREEDSEEGAVIDLKLLHHDLVRFETELWDAVVLTTKASCGGRSRSKPS